MASLNEPGAPPDAEPRRKENRLFIFERYTIKSGRDMAESKFATDLAEVIDPDWLSPVRREITDNLSGLRFSAISRRRPSEPVKVEISPLQPSYPLAPGIEDEERMRKMLTELAETADPDDVETFIKSYESDHLPHLRAWEQANEKRRAYIADTLTQVVRELTRLGCSVTTYVPDPTHGPEDMTVRDLLAIDDPDEKIAYLLDNVRREPNVWIGRR